MPSFEPINEFGFPEPPPRPTTPPVRRGFVLILLALCLAALVVYGVPYVSDRAGYAWEAGRSRSALQSLAKLDSAGTIGRASELFRMASTAVAPAVVHIQVSGAGKQGPHGSGGKLGLGSGVVIDKQHGYIVTNHHVVKDASLIVVHRGRTDVTAHLVGADSQSDLAVVQVDGPLPVEAEWGDSDKLETGDWVLAIGSPFALDQTVTAGIVSATRRNGLHPPGESAYEDYVQTDAAINPGNSGGPLIDLRGKVVGINTAILSESGAYQGIGFAISSNMARKVVDQLIKKGKVTRGYLGVAIADLRPGDAVRFNLPDGQGAIIADVQPEGPADKAGLRPGDVVVTLGDQPIADGSSLRNRTAGLAVGGEVPVTVIREGKPETFRVTIGKLPVLVSLGIRLRKLTPDQTAKFPDAAPNGLVIQQVIPGSPGFRAGLAPGWWVLGVGSKPVNNTTECEEAAERFDRSQGVPLQVMTSDGREQTYVVGGPQPGPQR